MNTCTMHPLGERQQQKRRTVLFQFKLVIGVLAFAGLVATVNANIFVKTNNATALNLAGSYTNNAVPTFADTIQVDNTLLAAQSAPLGDNLTVYAISQTGTPGVNSNAFALTISATTGKTLTIGAGGITRSAAGTSLLLGCALALGTNQVWTIPGASTSQLQLSGPSFTDNGYTLSVNGTGRIDLNNTPGATTYGPNVTLNCSQVTVNSSTADIILGGANGFTNLLVNQGIVEGSSFPASSAAGTTSHFGTGSAGTITLGGNNTSGTLIYKGNTAATPKSFTFDCRNSGANTIKVSTAGQTLTLTNLLYANSGSQTNDRNWNFGGAGNLTLAGAVKVSGSASWKIGITKNDAGTLTLGGTNTYTGNTLVNAGTLALTGNGSIFNTPLISLAAGTTFDVSGLSSFTLQAAQTISNASISTVTLAGSIDASSGTILGSFKSGVVPFTIRNGTLTLASSMTFNLTGLNPRILPGMYPIVTKGTGGSVVGATLPAVSLPGITAHLAINGGELDLVVDSSLVLATEPLHWAGSGSLTWDAANSGNPIWMDSGSPANSVYFLNGDDVRFDEQFISAPQTVALDSTVTPASTVVSNTTYSYIVSTTSGLGNIAGSGNLIKAGTNTLTLSVSNSFTGGTIISNGIIKVGNPAALATNGVTVRAGGVLDLNGTSMTNVNSYPLTINGSGIAGGGALVNGTGPAATFFGSIALGSDSTMKANIQNITLGSSSSAVPITGSYVLTVGGGYQMDIFGSIQVASVTEMDAGSIRLESANTFAGGLAIKSGTAIAKNAASYGGNGAGTIYLLDTTGTANATLALGASSTFNNPVIVQAGSTGTAIINNFGGPYLPIWAAAITLNNNLTLQSQGATPTGFITVSGPIGGSGNLTIGNLYAADTVKLSGTNTYTGSTYITVGTLALTNNGSIANTPLISLASGTTFDVSGLTSKKFTLGSGQTLANSSTGGTANLAGTNDASSGTVAVTFDGSTPVFAITSGSLKLSASTMFTINPTSPLSLGTYHLINSGVSGVAPASVSIPRRLAHLVINAGGGLDLVIDNLTEPTQPLHWAAAGAGLWQVLTPTNVWKDSSLSAVYSYFAGGDQVQFDEQFISADQVVTLNSTVTPASTLISNATHSYVISGTGTIGGLGGLTKTGPGTLTLSVAGTFTGGTVLANGTLMLGNAKALGASGGAVTVNSGAVMDVNGTMMSSANPYAFTLNGTGIAGAGALINSSATQATNYGSIVLATNSTINAIGATLTLGDNSHTVPITGSYPLTVRATLGNMVRIYGNVQADSVTKLDAGIIRLESANSFASGLTVKAGSVTAKNASCLGGDGSGTVYLLDTTGGDNATIDLGTSSTFNNSLIVQAGSTGVATLDDYLNYSPTWAGSITLNNDLNLQGSSGQTLAVTGPISGSGGLRITSWNTNGLVNLSGDNTYSGATYVTIGTLALKDAGTLSNTSPISVAGGATLDVSTLYSGTFTLGSGQTLANSLGTNLTGNLNGNIDASSGGVLVTYNGINPVFNVSGGVLTLSAATAFTVNPTSVLPLGTYNLIASGVSGSAPSTLTMLRGAGYLVINGGGGLDLVVTSMASGVTDPLHWAGTGTGLWQVATPANVWKDSSLAAVSTSYADADLVQFDEKFIAADQVVILNSTVLPPGVLISNALHSYTLSGPGSIGGTCGLTKLGSGTFTLATYNTYTGSTVISNGTLILNGSINSPVTVNGSTLGGIGFVNGNVTVNQGGTLAPGTNGLNRLAITNHLALNPGSTATFAVTGGVPSVNWVQTGGVTYGGTLNIVPTGTFHPGDQYQLFTGIGATNTSSFASIQGSPGSGLAFSFTNGWLGVVVASPSAPAYLTNTYTGGVLTLSWPSGQGWQLQSNSVSLSNTGVWQTVTGATPPYSITINPAQPTVFYRLKY